MEKEVRCRTCGTKIPIERDETGLIILSSLVCLKCNKMRCPRCGYPVVIEHLYDGVPVRLRCISAQCGFLKKILV
jgi:ssDNA-binding Zn-finger/Zn-ribbon topoisomerase 1